MSRYTVTIVATEDYRRLSVETRQLFDADMRKLERDPYNPPGMRSRAVTWADEGYREANAAEHRVVIRYRVNSTKVEVRVHTIVDPNLR